MGNVKMINSGLNKKGDCYEASLKYLQQRGVNDIQIISLVHGNVAYLNQAEDINHAWVEEGNKVHDVTNGNRVIANKEEYYRFHGITKIRRYALHDALIESVKAKHWGPWD